MASVDELIEYEQPRVEEAYRIGEAVLDRLRAPMQAANDKDAQTLQRSRRDRADRLDHLLRDDSSLIVRGRVDFAEDSPFAEEEGGRTFYVGIVHLTDYSDDDPQVVGWESERAEAWRNPIGKAAGPHVARVLTFDGQQRRLTDVQETRFRNGALEPGSVDPLLSRLASTSSGELTDVISTIQEDQFALMSHDPDQVMVVQGAPGTGKTIIGLHRVSVLLFRSGGEMTESDVLVVGPSGVFLDYVRGLLPSLGRGHVQQVEISAVGRPLELRLTGRDSTAARRVKGSAVMADVIRAYIDQRVGADVDTVQFDGVGPLEGRTIQRVLESSRAATRTYTDLRDRLRENLLIELVGRREEAQQEFLRTNRQALNNLLNRLVPTQSAQDLSPMQLRALDRRSLGGMTILGDLAQATSPWAPNTWADHLTRADIEIDHTAELLTGYRTVGPIVDFTNRLLPVINVDVPEVEALVTEGDDPVVVAEDGLESVVKLTLDFADATILHDDSPGRLGIIADEEELDAVAAALRTRDRSDEPLDWNWAGDRLTSSVTLVPADSAKGLEFDTVFVLEPSKLYERDPVTGPRLLYVALTRARHGLTVVHTQRLPAVLRDGEAVPPEPVRTTPTPDPSTATATMEPSAPERPATTPLPPTPLVTGTESWSHVVSTGTGLVLVRVAGAQASVEQLPDGAGAPDPLAVGVLVEAGETIAWAMQDHQGAFAVTTSRDRGTAAERVVHDTLER